MPGDDKGYYHGYNYPFDPSNHTQPGQQEGMEAWKRIENSSSMPAPLTPSGGSEGDRKAQLDPAGFVMSAFMLFFAAIVVWNTADGAYKTYVKLIGVFLFMLGVVAGVTAFTWPRRGRDG